MSKKLTVDDDLVIIASKHPSVYAFSVSLICDKFGSCKIKVNKEKKYTWRTINDFGRMIEIEKSHLDNWRDVAKLLGNGNYEITNVIDDDVLGEVRCVVQKYG